VSFGGERGPEIGKIRDVKIKVPGPPEGEITLRVYEPEDLKEGEKRPVYLNFHGGGRRSLFRSDREASKED
jgi:acetyl esterase/lipase